MKENLTFNQDPNDIMRIQSMVPLKDSNKNITSCKTDKSPKEFYISSIKSELTTMKSILGKKEYEPDEKIFILKISGKINFSSISWDIYKTPKELIELFDKMEIELAKNDEYIISPVMSRYFKLMKSYTVNTVPENIDKIIHYLMYFYNETKARNCCTLKEALQISAISFYNNNGIKPFEGYACKKAEPRILRQIFRIFLAPLELAFFNDRNKRWIVLKDDMICYMNDPNKMIGKNAYWFDENFEINPVKDDILEMKNLNIKLNLKFESKFQRDLWYMEINKRIEKKTSEILYNKYHSFTTQKSNCKAKWFIDGENYFGYLFEQLKKAKESVHITDWFLSPPVALKRPICYEEFLDEKNDYKKHLTFENASRLMDVLYLLAKRGVHIYILLFYEIKLALPLNSSYAKKTLSSLHPNIKVTRHPKGSSSILWSHHEKLVIIDQQIAFVGGLDLCWGRYDTHKHPIVEEENEKKNYFYPGADYMSERTCDMHDVDKFNVEQIDRNKYPRFGWHDIHTMVEGPIVSDIMRHFVERWNFARSFKRNNQLVRVGVSTYVKRGKYNKKGSANLNRNEINLNNIYNNDNDNDIDEKINDDNNDNNDDDNNKNKENKDDNDNDEDPFAISESRTFRGNIDIDSIEKKFLEKKEKEKKIKKENIIKEEEEEEKEEKEENEINTKEINTNTNTNDNIINDIYNIDNNNNTEDNNDILMKGGEEDDDDSIACSGRDSMRMFNDKDDIQGVNNNNYKSFGKIFSNIKNKIKNKYDEIKSKKRKKSEEKKLKQKIILSEEVKDDTISSNFKIQALRSVCPWSIGLTTTEHSILEGYYKLIDNSKHYIYIENQFFITKPYSEEERRTSGLNLKKLVENEIALHIRNRIELAFEKKEKFRVYICIPLLPGFPGVPGENSTLDAVLKYTLQSIGNNKGYSLMELLEKKMGKEIDNYIYFFSLRNHATLHDVPVSELIYIHSKLLIVDDQKVLIGSANINDRSMLGERDSEFAVVMEEDLNYDSIMNNKEYEASEYAASLRKNLMSEHFNIDINDKILEDPLNDKLWDLMKFKAEKNTSIYDNIFDCFPHNKFNTFKKLKERRMFKTKEEIEKLKKNYSENIHKIDGHIVEYPYKFLKDDELNIDFFSKENLVPEKNFT